MFDRTNKQEVKALVEFTDKVIADIDANRLSPWVELAIPKAAFREYIMNTKMVKGLTAEGFFTETFSMYSQWANEIADLKERYERNPNPVKVAGSKPAAALTEQMGDKHPVMAAFETLGKLIADLIAAQVVTAEEPAPPAPEAPAPEAPPTEPAPAPPSEEEKKEEPAPEGG